MHPLHRHMLISTEEHPIIRSPADAVRLFAPEMAGSEQEQMRVLWLNTKNQAMGQSLVYQGSVHTTAIRVAEIFREAVRRMVWPSLLPIRIHPGTLLRVLKTSP